MGSTGTTAGPVNTGNQTRTSIPKSNVTVNVTMAAGLNGAPRGTGTWVFFTDRARSNFDTAITVYGKYSDAKKQAIAIAAERGDDKLYLGT